MTAMLADAQGSVEKESGCLLFYVVEDNEDPKLLHLSEVYSSEEALAVHKETPHFKTWVETTADWLAAPLDISTGSHIFPDDQAWTRQN